MTWECCNMKGECQRGPGCPAGVIGAKEAQCATAKAQALSQSCAPGMCESSPGCRDLCCPAHPGLSWSGAGLRRVDVARIKSRTPKYPQAQPPSWRRYLPDLVMWMAKLVGALCMIAALTAWISYRMPP